MGDQMIFFVVFSMFGASDHAARCPRALFPELGSRAIAQFSLILLHNPAARQQWGETSVLRVDL